MIQMSVNDVLRDENTGRTFRILWMDEGSLLVFLIDVHDPNAIPFIRKTRELGDMLVSEDIIKIKNFNLGNQLQEIDINDKQVQFRDKAWGMIVSLVEAEPEIYQPKQRGQMIRSLVREKNYNKTTLFKHLRRYWQRGKTKNALLPDYYLSGGKGKAKNLSEKKVGKPRESGSIGINVTEEIKEIFRRSIKKHYLSSKKNKLTHAYRMMIKENFADDFYFENGVKKVIISDYEAIPSERQFRYFFDNEFGIKEVILPREGSKKYEKDHRSVLGSSTFETFGPGSRFQIDATIANVYLISSYNVNWIIGRPIVYYIVDVFSRLITGVYVGLEGPSWAGAMMALANAATNKVEYCKSIGISISEQQWPSEHLPVALLGDKGELEGFNVEPLGEGLDVRVENTSAFRADWKGIVEKLFDTSQMHLKPFLPGYIESDFRERGAEDYRLNAKLTLEQYTRIIIKFVLHYNKYHYIKDYIRDAEMIESNVRPTPIELWNWGKVNRAGKLKQVSDHHIKFYLLPQNTATVTKKGIRFKNMFYSCETAVKEMWFDQARSKKIGSWKVSISYDPRNMSSIYLHKEQGELFEPCYLLDHQERYQNKTYDEVIHLLKYEKSDSKEAEHIHLIGEIDFISEIEAEVEKAVKLVKNQSSLREISKSKKVGEIRINRAFEKEEKRQQESFNHSLDNERKNISTDVENKTPKQEVKEDAISLPSIRNLFDKKRR